MSKILMQLPDGYITAAHQRWLDGARVRVAAEPMARASARLSPNRLFDYIAHGLEA